MKVIDPDNGVDDKDENTTVIDTGPNNSTDPNTVKGDPDDKEENMTVDNGENKSTDNQENNELNYWRKYVIIFVVLFCLMVIYRLIIYK